eukprot:TRINITY_DN59463_c0_g1_i1.p2 TRINITY_DN59463_c0_g1~~TRINITY_DN59463_c0_g1_i1.p2  ORF type:complete len:128 (+),score=19.29 TRINITY_DN59463_c0_g1_i1:159-542(+)
MAAAHLVTLALTWQRTRGAPVLDELLRIIADYEPGMATITVKLITGRHLTVTVPKAIAIDDLREVVRRAIHQLEGWEPRCIRLVASHYDESSGAPRRGVEMRAGSRLVEYLVKEGRPVFYCLTTYKT